MLHILHTNPHTHNQKNTKFNVLCLCLIHQCENSKQYHADCQPPNKKKPKQHENNCQHFLPFYY